MKPGIGFLMNSKLSVMAMKNIYITTTPNTSFGWARINLTSQWSHARLQAWRLIKKCNM
jgi:hypothetical protein